MLGTALALVTDRSSLPIDYDMPLLLEACAEAGLEAEVCSWDDPDVDWSRFDAVLLRSPWSYVENLPRFLSWCSGVAGVTRLLNPLRVIRWNLDKRYLADLTAAGVPVVPSAFLAPGTAPLPALRAFLAAHPRAAEIVVKPTVGAYSRHVQRFPRTQEAEAAGWIAELHGQGHHVILQPYLDSVDHDGETNLIYFDGVYSHAIRKRALLGPDGTVGVPTLDARSARHAREDERSVASAALAASADLLDLRGPLLYGRVDLVRGADGAPVVLELELCEPSLSMPFSASSADRFVRAIAARLADPALTPLKRQDVMA
ncbi:RimK family alpha-L-glutamate ligase [Streptomyces sp. NPDC056361]|uniref:ATP-grasp domain-containing protein n=1 Tax=Streptomyces sp. NPDC056361 TaxID=3345795 RepID=UPI0035D56799